MFEEEEPGEAPEEESEEKAEETEENAKENPKEHPRRKVTPSCCELMRRLRMLQKVTISCQ